MSKKFRVIVFLASVVLIIATIGAVVSTRSRPEIDLQKSWIGTFHCNALNVEVTLSGCCIRSADEESDELVVWARQPSFSIRLDPLPNTKGGALNITVLNALPDLEVSGTVGEKEAFKQVGSTTMAGRVKVRSQRVLSFKPKQTPEKIHFVVTGDIRPQRRYSRKVFNNFIEALKEEQPDFVLATGDLTNHGDEKDFLELMERLKLLRVPFYAVPGDHETGDANEGLPYYRHIFGKTTYYSFDYGPAHFVLLDDVSRLVLDNGKGFAEKGTISPTQMSWMEQDIKTSVRPYKFVFMHIPPFDPRPGESHCIKHKATANQFMNIVQAKKVHTVFCGHIHGFWDVERDDVRYVFAAGGGAKLYKPKTYFNYVRVVVDGAASPENAVTIEPVELSSR